MTPIHCHHCGRLNGETVTRCIWCGAHTSGHEQLGTFIATTLDVDYLEGIDRLADPGPVRLVISPDGIEIVEVLPGSRSIKIPAASILEADLAYAPVAEPREERPWWRNLIKPLRTAPKPSGEGSAEGSDHILRIKYRDGDEVRTGVFSRSSQQGLISARKLAGILGKLAGERQSF